MIKVSNTLEIHEYIAKQRCNCKGFYHFKFSKVDKENDQFIDTVTVECSNCHIQRDYIFNITKSINGGSLEFAQRVKETWKIPNSGPYLSDNKLQINEYKENNTFLPFGEIAGRYKIIGEKNGSMGKIYLCTDQRDKSIQLVVCKTLDLKPETIDVTLLKNEAETWLKLSYHQNIVNLLNVVVESNNRLILVMEAINPFSKIVTLEDWVRKSKNKTNEIKINMFRDIIQGMLYCRYKIPNFIHGDLKPENLFIDYYGNLKIGDFGLSGTTTADLFRSHGISTKLYLAPECFDGNPKSEKSDIYSFGLIMYEVLTGKHPFNNYYNEDDLINRHKNYTMRPLTFVPHWISSIILKCLQKDPNNRPTFLELSEVFNENDVEICRTNNADNNNVANVNIASSLINIGNHKEAFDLLLQTGIELEGVGINLAVILSREGIVDMADMIYEKLLSQVDVPIEAYLNFSTHLLRHYFNEDKKLEQAIGYCDEVLKRNKFDLQALINKSALLNSMGKFNESEKISLFAKSIYPRNPHVLFEFATSNFFLGKRGKALYSVNRILLIDPLFSEAIKLKQMIENEWQEKKQEKRQEKKQEK
ncbi:serine/threonine-protein kinase [Brevibacillus choshinensis]|uniref:Protein kinase n=1 Tax=Brevibacillus choshinensis TaxID=54911 RepID=A0ABX7FJT9_BRECH|nr:serine/threonine-protein kinase [Brevibacillus choshinensis]QRG65952.1 protein kinase [Brevibacillus choshinensis]